ncbi:UNVERIFIED_CONTAM: putative E3 ubiquitin-protein ligase LUL4 [Sesamum calycinum]|uniref:RING-type E3 ubiquitin transferase n=1 Tax=Sesamum calycinum TaxID=2727403 RepID=A0AAW2R9B9_9LAMI
MGISFSTTARRRSPTHPYPHPHPHPLEYYPSSYHMQPPPPPYPAHSPSSPSVYYPYYNSNAYNVCNHANPIVGQPYFGPFELQPSLPQPRVVAPPCDEQKQAKVVNSDVNVHKDSLRLEIDELNPDHYLNVLSLKRYMLYISTILGNWDLVPLFPVKPVRCKWVYIVEVHPDVCAMFWLFINEKSTMSVYHVDRLSVAYFITFCLHQSQEVNNYFMPGSGNEPLHLAQASYYLLSVILFTNITIYYFAKEEADCRVVPLFPETYVPIKIPFRKGLHQEFRQPSGTGIDLRYFSLDDMSNPSSRYDVFPIVISADTCPTPYIVDDRSYLLPPTLSQMQITQAVVGRNHDGQFTAKAIRQLLWTDDICYELREIYGLGKSGSGFNDNGSGKDCVICMTEPKDIAVLPCRHMGDKLLKRFSLVLDASFLFSFLDTIKYSGSCSGHVYIGDCAKALRLQSNKCPICREVIEALLEIKIDNIDQ